MAKAKALKSQNDVTEAKKSKAKNDVQVKKVAKIKNVTSSSKAGLVFPVGRISRLLKQGRYSEMFGKGAVIFLAAVLEYLTCEILELAGNAAADEGKHRITPRHLQLSVRNDEELAKLMSAVMISNGGFITNIHPFLIKGKKGKKVGEDEKDGAQTQEM